jgi:rRNA maturation RNase YbeY
MGGREPSLNRARTAETSPSTLAFSNRRRLRRINTPLLRRIALAALADLPGVTGWDLTFYLVGARKMAAINQTHLGHEGSTDVITFDYGDGEKLGAKRALRGEIFICVDVAITQAKEFGTTWQSEVVRYLVHGLLHLYGYDDLSSGPRRAMKQVENRMVRKLSGAQRT